MRVATPCKIPELSEDEEKHEIYEFIEAEQFDCLVSLDEVIIDGKRHTCPSSDNLRQMAV